MQAALLETSPGALVIGEVELDRPESREVLIRTAAAGGCHCDLHFIEGNVPAPDPDRAGPRVGRASSRRSARRDPRGSRATT